MRKIFLFALMLMMSVSSDGFAMTLSQPQWVGGFYRSIVRPWYGISGESYNSAKPIKGSYYHGYAVNENAIDRNGHKWNLYVKGVARFSDGEDALYLHYKYDSGLNDDGYERIGGKDFNNTLDFLSNDIAHYNIFKISTDSGYTFYLLGSYAPINSSSINYYIIIGRKPDGSWIRFFDTVQMRKNYGGSGVFAYQIFTDKDTLITRYHVEKESYILGSKDYNPNERGEFRFKWDDEAQWFGVQHVKY